LGTNPAVGRDGGDKRNDVHAAKKESHELATLRRTDDKEKQWVEKTASGETLGTVKNGGSVRRAGGVNQPVQSAGPDDD